MVAYVALVAPQITVTRREKAMMEDRGGYGFEEAWESVVAAGKEEDRKRRENFKGVFAAGGADVQECERHYQNVLGALLHTGCFETLATLLRGFGFSEEAVLGVIKRHHLHRRLPPGRFWEAVRTSGVRPDPRAVVAALEEVSKECDGFDDVPF